MTHVQFDSVPIGAKVEVISAIPTIFPTPQPTQIPTILPTPYPTIFPTILPTPYPTIIPTPTPTVLPLNVYYVAKDGSDLNPGTKEKPWKTIQYAADILVPGEKVIVRGGTYKEQIEITNSGAIDDEIIYMAHPNEKVIIDGTSVPVDHFKGLFELVVVKNIIVDDFDVINSQECAIAVRGCENVLIKNNYTYSTQSSGILSRNSKNIVVTGNEVEYATIEYGQEMISFGTTEHFEISNNYVHNGSPIVRLGGEGINAKTGCSYGEIYGNHVHGIPNTVGIYVDAWNQYTHDINVYNNDLHNNRTGFQMASEKQGLLKNINVYNNKIYNNNIHGIKIDGYGLEPDGPWDGPYCEGCGGPMENITIINNTIFNNGYRDWGGGIFVGHHKVTNFVVRNNISSKNYGFQLMSIIADHNEIKLDHNLLNGENSQEWSGDIYTWHTVTGDNVVFGNPEFVGPNEYDLHLKSGSPAIDVGSSIGAPKVDYDGNNRPKGIGYDIGAYEYY